MRSWTNEIIVGASIVISLFLLIFGYVYLREIPVRQKGYEVFMIFNNVTGLESGDAVTVAGLKVGRVQEMELNNSHVSVRVWLNGEVPFSYDSRAMIRSIGMIGEKYIDLMPGSGERMLKDDDTVVGDYISDLADAGGGLNELMAQTNLLLVKLTTALDSSLTKEAQRAVAATLVNTEYITSQLRENLEKNMAYLNNTLASFDTISLGLKNYWQKHHTTMDSISYNLARSSSQLPGLMAQLDSTITTTQKLLAVVENQQGTVGKAFYDDELYHRANQTIHEAQSLLEDVKKNPGKYLQISVIDLF